MKPATEAAVPLPRFSMFPAAMLGGLVAMIIFVIQRAQNGFSIDGAGPMLLWHLLVGSGAFALGALIRNRLVL